MPLCALPQIHNFLRFLTFKIVSVDEALGMFTFKKEMRLTHITEVIKLGINDLIHGADIDDI